MGMERRPAARGRAARLTSETVTGSMRVAIADHLGVYGIIQALLAPVLVTPSSLTLRSTADGLVETAFGRLKGLLAIRAAARREKSFPPRFVWIPTLRKSDLSLLCR